MDLMKIAVIATAECIRQEATEVQDLINLLRAYERALALKEDPDSPVTLRQLVIVWGSLIYPKNEYGYRMVPVTFQNGGASSNWQDIHTHMERLFENSGEFGVEDAYSVTRSFLQIHPFRDGNGRTAWILYNWLNGTLEDPVALPDFNF